MEGLHRSIIRTGLETILSKGGNGNFVIFELPSRENHYIQVAGENQGSNLWVEAGFTENLNQQQKKLLSQMGWESPEEANLLNYSKQIPIQSLDDCSQIAEMILETFIVVYELKGNEKILDKINLE